MDLKLSEIKIPPLPTVTIKVMLFDITDPANGIHELEKLINPDKGITSELLRIANSAFYGRSGSVKNLRDAITLMGIKTVKNLVILQSTKNIAARLKGDVYKTHLQILSILTALIAFDLGTPLGFKKTREDLFLCGLLHKIGMTILAVNYPKEYQELLKDSESGDKTLLALETEKLGINFIELSLKVFEFWKIPQMLADVVAAQTFSKEEISKVSDNDRLVRLADILARKMLSLHVSPEIEELELALFKHYEAPEELINLFHTDYFENIQDHPFFELAT
ncbi:MAG: HDOD domain-containing protein [Leptospiraceae bacterium]|nr:HDOD domain-containing protein [Leptospiraceae bacterium]MCP5502160.1 HDOD domain-containing protein [Leptospiraceae bacterium]